jgi:hypothetical protein
MVNLKMIAIVAIAALVGLGGAALAFPMDLEVSAQGNETGNMTGNYTDSSLSESGNISGAFIHP